MVTLGSGCTGPSSAIVIVISNASRAAAGIISWAQIMMKIYILGTEQEDILLVPDTCMTIGNATSTSSSMVKTVEMLVKQAIPGDL